MNIKFKKYFNICLYIIILFGIFKGVYDFIKAPAEYNKYYVIEKYATYARNTGNSYNIIYYNKNGYPNHKTISLYDYTKAEKNKILIIPEKNIIYIWQYIDTDIYIILLSILSIYIIKNKF